jgi:hypothetical protein
MTPGYDDEVDREELDLLLRGFQVSCMLRAAAEIGLPDALPVQGQVSVDSLGAACNALPEPLLRMIRALAAFGVFRLAPGEMVEHTPRSRLLRTDARNSMHHGARFWTGPGAWGAWGKLETALRGQVPHEVAWNTDRFAYLRQHPDELSLFDAMMANFPDDRHSAIAGAYDFAHFEVIADIGGGNGATLRHILGNFESPRGILFDQHEVVGHLGDSDLLNGRISARGGSFFDGVPGGADLYMLLRVLHDWSDADCLRILQRCRAAMAPRALLLIGEHLLQPDPTRGRPADYLTDMQMMAMFGSARQRSREELQTLIRRAGLDLRRVFETRSPVSILEAVPS